MKRGNTGVPMYVGLARFVAVAPLLYCADACAIQRKRGSESSLVVFGMARSHTHTRSHGRIVRGCHNKKTLKYGYYSISMRKGKKEKLHCTSC